MGGGGRWGGGGGGGTEKYISMAAAWGREVSGHFAAGAAGGVWCLTCPAYDMQHASSSAESCPELTLSP
jgi:hypothetical protein